MKKRLTAIVLAVAMIAAMMPVALAAGEYSDTQGHWGEAAIDRWTQAGVAEGRADGTFGPNDMMTREETAQMFVNLLHLTKEADISQYTDLDPASPYYQDFAKCVAAGIFDGTSANTMSPSSELTREQLFTTFARALGIQPAATSSVTFEDGNQVSSWAAGYINALANMGAVRGVGNGSLQPKADINRASVMSVLDQTISVYANTSGATVGESTGIVLVVADQVNVMGDVENLVVADGSASVTGSTVASVFVIGDKAVVNVSGSAAVTAVAVSGEGAQVNVSGQAQVGSVTVTTAAAGAAVNVSGSAVVNAVDAQANNVTIAGDGTVNSAVVSGSNTTVNTTGTDLTVSQGTTGVTQNGSAVSGGSTVETKPSTPTTPSNPTTPPVYIPNYYTVAFQYANGTTISDYIAMEYSAAMFPEVPCEEGQKVTWYENGTLLADTSNVIVTSNRTFTAVVGSDDFTAGNGTQQYPYLIANEDEFKAIGDHSYNSYVAAGGFSNMETAYYKLMSDIAYSTVVEFKPDPEKYPDYIVRYGFNYLIKAVIDGAGHTLIPGSGNYAFYNMYYSTLKNLNVIIDDCAIVDTCTYTNTFDNVDVSGSFEVNGNCGAYAIYAYCDSTLTFNNCVTNVNMFGTGGYADYNAAFVGCAYGSGKTLTLNFNNCLNQGSIVCGRAAMFIGNPYGPGQTPDTSDLIMNVTNCANNGEIRATYVDSNYTMNYFHAMPYPVGTVINLDGMQYSDNLDISNTALAGTGEFINGPDDATLALTKDESGNFTITAATNGQVAYYKIGIGLYTTYLSGGTNRFYVYSSEITDVNQAIDLKLLSFVDQTWLEQNPSAVEGALDGNKIYTLNGASYYFLTSVTDTLNGRVSAPTIIYVSAYDAAGNLLCSANLSN